MCHLNMYPEEATGKALPYPHLVHAMPVDVIQILARTEAYNIEYDRITAVRLCHRFAGGLLSKLPQEVLDMIVTELHEARVKDCFFWNVQFACFQGACCAIDHVDEHISVFPKDARGIYTNTDEFWDTANEMHGLYVNAWVRMLCLCPEPLGPRPNKALLAQVNRILNHHFGLQVHVMHEYQPEALQKFVPASKDFGTERFYTLCYLTLYQPQHNSSSLNGMTVSSRNQAFIKEDDRLAFHQRPDPQSLIATEEQNQRFAVAQRILGIKPHYHLTELVSRINPSNTDDTFWSICDEQVKGCPAPGEKSRAVKSEMLRQYMTAQDEALAKQSWPQLTLMSTSNIVEPS